jgi:hypothetical protein
MQEGGYKVAIRIFFGLSTLLRTSLGDTLLCVAIWRRTCVAFDTRQQAAEGFRPALCSDDPRPVAPGWIMPDMLVVVAALELSHPVLLIVLMKADNAALHGVPLVA